MFTKQKDGGWLFSVGPYQYKAIRNIAGFGGRQWELWLENVLIWDQLPTREACLVEAERNADARQNVTTHTIGGKPIGEGGAPYGTRHDMNCPACFGKPFTSTPRSETYWAS